MAENIKYSVITVCFNAAEKIEETIRSILNQSFPNFELIVIDGGSFDGTPDLIASICTRTEKNVRFISESDNGIYDAMNKGIRLAQGEYIIFMNAGDRFFSNSVLEEIESNTPGSDVVYGHHVVKYHTQINTDVRECGIPSNIWKGMVFSHQSAFVRSKLLRDNLYDLNEPVVADYLSFFRFLCDGNSFQAVDVIVSEIEAGGISDQRRVYCTWRRFKIVWRFRPSLQVVTFYFLELLKQFITVFVKICTPQSIHSQVRQFRRLREGSNV